MARSANVTWQDSNLSRASRWRALDARGATVWLTGLPSAGKSTLGAALEERLVCSGRFAYLLDGDNLRHGICGDLGFDEADRARNILRVGELARLFADAGAVAIVALVSPLAAARDEVRSRHTAPGCRSSRCSSTRRWLNARRATPRTSTRGHARESSPTSPAWARLRAARAAGGDRGTGAICLRGGGGAELARGDRRGRAPGAGATAILLGP